MPEGTSMRFRSRLNEIPLDAKIKIGEIPFQKGMLASHRKKMAIDILKEYNHGSRVLFHCFSGSVEFMRECVKQGWYIALGGVVTFKNAQKMKDVACDVPLDKLVLETDSPYLTPVPYRGKPNTPAYVSYVAQEIAKLREMSLDELVNITTENAERFFDI